MIQEELLTTTSSQTKVYTYSEEDGVNSLLQGLDNQRLLLLELLQNSWDHLHKYTALI